MVRKQLHIEPRQEELPKRRSMELGLSGAELIRQGLSIAAAGDGGQGASDPAAWNRARAFIEEKLMARRAPQTSRDWTREELYEERLSRLSRGH